MKYILFSILYLFLFGCTKSDTKSYTPNVNCICNEETVAIDKYLYPNAPPSKKWDSLFNVGGYSFAYDNILQVPFSESSKMSTLGLIQSILENPTIHSSFAFQNSWFIGKSNYLKNLYASWELNKRADAGRVMAEYYTKKTPCCINKISPNDSLKISTYIYSRREFEVIFTQDSILSKLKLDEKKQFIRTVIDYYYMMDLYPQFGNDKTTSSLLLSSIMLSASYAPYINEVNSNGNLKNFALGSILSNNSIFELIILHAKQFAVN